MPAYARTLLRKPKGAKTLDRVYHAPNGAFVVIQNIVACNVTNKQDAFSISLVEAKEDQSPDGFLYRGKSLGPNETFVHTAEIHLGPGDDLRMESVGQGIAFHVFGSERR